MTSALRRADLADALSFVQEAGQAGDSHAFHRHVLERLPRLVPTTMISYNDISPDGDPVLLLDPPDAWTEQRERDFIRLAGEHPLISHYHRTGDTRPLKISDVMSRREFRRTELYRTVYGPMNVEYQMAVTLPGRPGDGGGHRAEPRPAGLLRARPRDAGAAAPPPRPDAPRRRRPGRGSPAAVDR